MKDKFFLAVGIAIVVWSFYVVWHQPARGESLKIGDKIISVEIADTNAERVRGLSGRDKFETGHGMLFVFEEAGFHGIWMKEMRFSIDIAWLDENWNLVGIEKNVSPESFPHIFYPPTPVKYILEINAGELD